MRPEEHAQLARVEREYWWHVGRRDILRIVLDRALSGQRDRRILDVGCGTGGNVPLLAAYGSVVALDESRSAVSFATAGGAASGVCASARWLPVQADSADVISLLDVLEHIEDHMGVLLECRRVLKPGGLLLLSVPAYQWLWSGHDEVLGHRRRYRRGALNAQVAAAGLTVIRSTYAVSVVFPIIAGYRLLERLISRRQATSYVVVLAS